MYREGGYLLQNGQVVRGDRRSDFEGRRTFMHHFNQLN